MRQIGLVGTDPLSGPRPLEDERRLNASRSQKQRFTRVAPFMTRPLSKWKSLKVLFIDCAKT